MPGNPRNRSELDDEPVSDSLHREIWRVSDLLRCPPTAPQSGYRLDDLESAFIALADADDPAHEGSEDRIWAIWCDHPDPEAKSAMRGGIKMLAERQLDRAQALFDVLTQQHSDWAEAWNKRATVAYLRGYDCASAIDIARTLKLEPRHFGAMGGFAQICMRNDSLDGAYLALQQMLVVNPLAPGIEDAVIGMSKDSPNTVH
jgi:hypothetical protein